MQLKPWLARVIALLAIAALTGCGLHRESFTYKLCESDAFHDWREPATNAAVAVHYAPARKDYLVTYDSLRDDGQVLRKQAYFLGDYEAHRVDRRKPRLISPRHLELVPVPVNGATNLLPYATFDRQLTIQTAAGQIGPYTLPTYAESGGTIAKSALTPLTVTADAVCLSLIVALVAAVAYAHSGGYVPCD
jgi:hypothetical protein